MDDYFKSPVFASPQTQKIAEENCKQGNHCIPELPDFDIIFNNLDSQYKDYIEPSKVVEIGTNKWTRYLGDGLLAPTYYTLVQDNIVFNFGVVQGSDENILKEILSTFKFIEPQSNGAEGSEIFKYKNVTLTYEQDSKYGLSIIYNKSSSREVLIKGLIRDIYSEKQLIFYKTKLPNIVRVRNGMGDAGIYMVQEYYIDLDTKKYFNMEYSSEQKINIKDFEGKTYTINLAKEGTCFDGSVQLVGININDQTKYVINPSINQKCGIPDFNPWDTIATAGLSQDFNKVFFYYTIYYQDTNKEEKNYFSFNLKTGQVQKEKPVGAL